jgi:hypothetical protein
METNQIFDPIFGISIKNYPIAKFLKKTSVSTKNMGLCANFCPQSYKAYNSRFSECFFILKPNSDSPENLVGYDVVCFSKNVFNFFLNEKNKKNSLHFFLIFSGTRLKKGYKSAKKRFSIAHFIENK